MNRDWWCGTQGVEMPRWCWGVVVVAVVVSGWKVAAEVYSAVVWLSKL